jgi:hypothetical protein
MSAMSSLVVSAKKLFIRGDKAILYAFLSLERREWWHTMMPHPLEGADPAVS